VRALFIPGFHASTYNGSVSDDIIEKSDRQVGNFNVPQPGSLASKVWFEVFGAEILGNHDPFSQRVALGDKGTEMYGETNRNLYWSTPAPGGD
jgi:hypothetical protein